MASRSKLIPRTISGSMVLQQLGSVMMFMANDTIKSHTSVSPHATTLLMCYACGCDDLDGLHRNQ